MITMVSRSQLFHSETVLLCLHAEHSHLETFMHESCINAVYVLISHGPVHHCGLPPVRCSVKPSPSLWENNITATAA